MSIGLARADGGLVTGWDHVVQSMTDIFTTPIGSRVMRRDYGSELPQLIDQPMTPVNVLRVYAAVATTLQRWEPRVDLKTVQIVEATSQGRLGLALTGDYLPRGHLGDTTTREPFGAFVLTL